MTYPWSGAAGGAGLVPGGLLSEPVGESQERAAFDRRHESEAIEMTVLTGSSTTGAGKVGQDVLWTPSADVLAYVDANVDTNVDTYGDARGVLMRGAGRLSWLATDEQRATWIHDLQPHTQYVVRVRRAAPDPAEYAKHGQPVPDLSGHFALDEVLERDVHLAVLDERLARWLEPATVASDLGDLTLERASGHFSGTIDWAGCEVEVQLDVDEPATEGAETCAAALGRLVSYAADAAATDACWRAYAATMLVDLANDWQNQAEAERDHAGSITTATFAERINLIELAVAADGSVTPCYADGDLFLGHVILIDVEPDGTMSDAYIAG